MKHDLVTSANRASRHSTSTQALYRWLRIGLGALVFATGAGKALDVAGFAEVIRTYRLALPDGMLLPIGACIAALELALGAWLVSGREPVMAARASIALNAGYCVLLTSALWRGLELDNCGCFGVFFASPLRWYSPLESLALVGASIVLMRLARP